MKVFIGHYYHWFRPAKWYKDWILWAYGFGYKVDYEKIDMQRLDDTTERIHDGRIYTALMAVENWVGNRYQRPVRVKIHAYDVWSLDNTLSLIILPALKMLKEKKQGSPYVEDADVPEELRSTAAPALTEEEQRYGHTDANFHKRWEWALDEMIWAFENMADDADDQFFAQKPFDRDGYQAWQERKTRGFTLFGKYFEALWD